MIKENQKLFNRLNVLTDAAAAFVSVAAAYLLVFNLLDFERNYPLADYLKLLLIFVPVQLLTYGCMGLYGSFRSKRFTREFGRLFTAFLLDGLALVALLYLVQIFDFSRWALAIFLVLDFLLVTLKRFMMRKLLRKFRRSGYNQKHVLIVGSGAAARDYLRTIKEEKHLGFVCAGYVSDGELPGAEKKGGMSFLLSVLEERSYDEVVCALDPGDDEKLGGVVEACELTGTKISVIPSIYKYMSSTPAIDVVGNIPLMNIRRIPLDNIGNAILKRALDIVGSAVLLILTSPVILVSMLVIKLTMGGEVIFRQKRVGLNKKVFTMYKLKSMRDSAESDTAWSKDTDPRRTKFGAFIRKFSIDELPQLVNVLKGEMSLVGPRPEIPFYVNDFKDKIPMYMIKHQVKPGITGLAQINGYRGDTSIEKRIEFDVQYIENWSFFLDISILIRTALSGFMNSEKLSGKSEPGGRKKKYRPEKFNMNNNKAKIDLMALAMFLPSVVAAAVLPIIIHVSRISTTFVKTFQFFGGNIVTADDGTVSYDLFEAYSQAKGVALVVFALIMLGMALVCCISLFRRVERRSLAYVGASVVFVAFSLASALGSDYQQIAFFGEYDRAEGFWSLACYFVLFLFSMYAFRTAGNFKPLSIALFVAVGVNVLIGIFQMTGNDLLGMDWFVNIVKDRSLSDVALSSTSTTRQAYGALYNPNYVGSFAGLIIPLFTVMAIYSREIIWRVLYIVFDLAAVLFLVGSTARSGIVAVAAALVVGIIVFARQIGRHWKRCAAVAAAAAVIVTGANFALGNKLFQRIPSLVQDAVGLFLPADEADRDLYSKIPLREIRTPGDNTVVFTGQDDVLTASYDGEIRNYVFTDSEGREVPSESSFVLGISGYDGLKITAHYLEKYVDVSLGGAHMRYTINDDGALTDDNSVENAPQTAEGSSIIAGAMGVVGISDGSSSFYMEYDTDYKRLFFTTNDEEDIQYNETVSFPGRFDGVHIMLMNSDEASIVRDVMALTFNDDSSNSLFFMLENEKRITMIHYRTSERFDPVNADHIGFEGKETLGSSRGYIWSRTLPLLKNCLLTGYGADTFAYVFPQNDVLAKYYSYEQFGEGFYITVDKPHNMYLQIFYGNGLIAFAAFLAICVFYLVDCFRLYALRREYRPEQIMGAAVMLGVVGYLAAGMFNDSVVHVAPLFWILLGVGAALNTINRRADRNIKVDEDYVPVQPENFRAAEPGEKDRETADAAKVLAAIIRSDREKELEKQRAEKEYTPTKEDISNLLESVRALSEKHSAEKAAQSGAAESGEAPQEEKSGETAQGEDHDDNG